MTERTCRVCGKPFEPKTADHVSCSAKCQMQHWRNNNREKYNADARKWRAAHPDRVAFYNSKKKVVPPQIECPHCGASFQRRSGSNRFCSVKCQSKVLRERPVAKNKHRAYQTKWRAKNRDRNNTYHRAYHKNRTQRILAATPWKSLLSGAKERAKKTPFPFELDSAWAEKRWTGCCELTGLEFSKPAKRIGYKARNFSPSIDRIDPTKGYTKENCRIILWAVNSFKRDSTDADMFRIAEALVARVTEPRICLSLPG